MANSENEVTGPIHKAKDYLYCPIENPHDYNKAHPWPYVRDRLMQYEFGRLGTTPLLCLGRSVLQHNLENFSRVCAGEVTLEQFLSSLTEMQREKVIYLLLSLQDGAALQKTFRDVSKKQTPEPVPLPNSAA